MELPEGYKGLLLLFSGGDFCCEVDLIVNVVFILYEVVDCDEAFMAEIVEAIRAFENCSFF